MGLHKAFKMMACCFCMTLSSVGLADPQPGPSQNMKAPIEVGVINRIDTARSQIVINDMKFAFSALTLKVHKGGRVSGSSLLQINQKVRFAYDLGRPGSTSGAARVLTDIWLD